MSAGLRATSTARGLEGLDLGIGGVVRASDDGARVAHAAAGGPRSARR